MTALRVVAGVCVMVAVGCKSRAPRSSPDAAAAIAPAPDAAVTDAGPPPIVDVTVRAVATPPEVSQLQNGERRTYTPPSGQRFVVVSAELSFRACPDGTDTLPAVHIATAQGALVLADATRYQATGGGIGDQCLGCNVEVNLPCDKARERAQPMDFLFALPLGLELRGAVFEYRGTRAALP